MAAEGDDQRLFLHAWNRRATLLRPHRRIVDRLALAPLRHRLRVDDRGYDANALRQHLRAAGAKPVSPGRGSRKRPNQHDVQRYRHRWRIEAAFCRLKDFRRVATRYDKLAANSLSAVCLAAVVAFWA